MSFLIPSPKLLYKIMVLSPHRAHLDDPLCRELFSGLTRTENLQGVH